MIEKTAGLLRAGFLPAAAALTLMCSAALAEETAAPGKSASGTAQAPEGQGPASTEDKPAPPANSADKAAPSSTTSADKDKPGTAAADKTKLSDTDHSATDKAIAGPEPDRTAPVTAAKEPEPQPQKPADAAGTTKATDADKAATEKAAADKEADKNKAATDKTTADEAAAEKTAAEKEAEKDKAPAVSTAKVPEPPTDAAAATKATDADKAATDKAASDKAATHEDKASAPSTTTGSEPAVTGPDTASKTPADAKASIDAKAPADAKDGSAPDAKSPGATAALPAAPPADTPSAGVADAPLPPADSVVADVRRKLPEALKRVDEDSAAALVAFYDALSGPAIWASMSGLTAKGKAVVEEIGKADDWGLPASDFKLPAPTGGSLSPEAAADTEIEVALAVLKYARYARGGRINPASISQLIDQSPTLIPPKRVLSDITVLDAPDAYLRSLHPKHVQFELLRQALLKARGSSEPEETPTEDPALAVKLPPGGILKPGSEDPQIALLRQRLKVPADDEVKENVYDAKLQDAVREFQRANNLRPDAIIGNNTRAILNGQPKPAPVTADAKIERILINMERWRWMPEELGEFYVWDNVPEALTRIVKNGKIIHTDKIIVGQPSWPTPSFSADMKTVVFHPSWGVPEGIKRKELAPLLRKSSGAGFFGIFGGGYSSQAVLDAYQLKAYHNGRQIDPNQVDWSSANIAAYSFQQPPGPKNVLGDVKFLFPNKHAVYMHDTPERHLFSRTPRNFSHGCMRIADPRRFAEIILAQDKGWSPEKVRSMFSGYSADVALDTHIPVHVTYITARVDDGRLRTAPDFYGLDSRTAAALTGRSVRFEQPYYEDEEVASDGSTPSYSRRPAKKQYQEPATLADAVSDIFGP